MSKALATQTPATLKKKALRQFDMACRMYRKNPYPSGLKLLTSAAITLNTALSVYSGCDHTVAVALVERLNVEASSLAMMFEALGLPNYKF